MDMPDQKDQLNLNPQPVSAPHKEAEPLISPSIPAEVVTDAEVKEAGVQEVSEVPQLTEQHFASGVRHAGPTVPVQTEAQGIVRIQGADMDEAEAQKEAKGDVFDARTWIASKILFFLKRRRLEKAKA